MLHLFFFGHSGYYQEWLIVWFPLEYLAEGMFFSVDPYMRPYSKSLVNEGTTMIGSQVAK